MKSMLTLAAVALAAVAVPAGAAVAVYSTANTTPGNQSFGGTLGLNFDVNSPIGILSFGAFDSGKDGITTDIFVTILDRNTGLSVAPTVAFNGTANPGGDAYVFKAVSPFALGVGNYQLVAYGYNDTDRNYNDGFSGANPIVFNNIGGKLTALDAAYGYTPGALGTNFDPGLTRYGAGTFSVGSIGGVPEPTTWGLMIVGFGLVGVGGRARRRNVVTA